MRFWHGVAAKTEHMDTASFAIIFYGRHGLYPGVLVGRAGRWPGPSKAESIGCDFSGRARQGAHVNAPRLEKGLLHRVHVSFFKPGGGCQSSAVGVGALLVILARLLVSGWGWDQRSQLRVQVGQDPVQQIQAAPIVANVAHQLAHHGRRPLAQRLGFGLDGGNGRAAIMPSTQAAASASLASNSPVS